MIEYKTFRIRPSLLGNTGKDVDDTIKRIRSRGWHIRSVWSHTNGAVYITAWTDTEEVRDTDNTDHG